MIKDSIAMCCLTVIPVRAEHDDASEIVTQLLFGEFAMILEVHNQWRKIQIVHDDYIGWVDNKQLIPISQEAFKQFNNKKARLQNETALIQTSLGRQTVLAGTPILSENKKFTIDKYHFEWLTELQTTSKSIVEIAMRYLNAPYLWGGRTMFGIDCSGFSQTVYQQAGIYINRDASQQVLQGEEIAFNNQQAGDLAFFKSEKTGNITHVGILLENNKIIHAHGRVRIDTLDETGIYDEKQKNYSHRFYNIKRHTKQT